MKRKIAAVVLVGLLSFVTMASTGCAAERASYFTEEEHLARVTERIEKKYMTEDGKFTSFAVYPLYNEKDKLQYFLVEFEPQGFVYVKIRDKWYNNIFESMHSLYGVSNTPPITPWYRYTIDPTKSQPEPYTDKCIERDENGEMVIRYKSPYAEAGVVNEKRYLLSIKKENNESATLVPAIKTDEGYLNLVSMSKLLIENGYCAEEQAAIGIRFIPKNYFDL